MSDRFSLSTPILRGAGLCVLASLAGCGGGNGPSAAPPPAVNSIVFVSTRDGAPEIYRMNPDGTEQTRVTTGIGSADHPSQSRDGRIVFESKRDGNSEIYTINRDGSELKRLTDDAVGTPFEDVEPTFSPDGKTIAWTSTRGDKADLFPNIWLMDSNGNNKRQFVFNSALPGEFVTVASSDPAWTADGKQLAYLIVPEKERPIGNNGLQLKTLATGAMTKPDYSFGPVSHFRFNNERKLIYTSQYSRSNGSFLKTYDVSSGNDTIVFLERYKAYLTDLSPDYSPDGQSIVWDSLTDNKIRQIYRASANGAAVAALTTAGENYSPDW